MLDTNRRVITTDLGIYHDEIEPNNILRVPDYLKQ